MVHHTKQKGDIGLAVVITDLIKRDWIVSLPIQEDAKYDLVASKGPCVYRIQVKYRTAKKNGVVEVPLQNSWGNATKGSVLGKPYTGLEIDYFVVTTGIEIAYIPISEVEHNTGSFMIRLQPPKNNQVNRCRFFSDYETLLTWHSGDCTAFVKGFSKENP